MPLNPVEDFEQCIREFMEKGDTPEKAKQRCGAIKADMEKANASILKLHTADMPCMCKALQTATADFYVKDGDNFGKFFLINGEENLKGWAVTADSMPKYLNSFIGKPFISEPDLGHFGADDMPVHQVMSKQEDFRVGDIVGVTFDEKTMTAEAVVKFHKTATAERIWNEIQKGDAIYVSPAVAGYSVDGPHGPIFHEWYGLHLARVANPAYGVFHASLKRTCTGDEKQCINNLVASAMANTSTIEKNTSVVSSFKPKTVENKQMAESTINSDEQRKEKKNPEVAETDEEKALKLEKENASLKSEIASLKKGTAQLDEVTSEVSQLKATLAEKEEEEKSAIVGEIMQIKEQLGVEDTDDTVQTVEEETASLMKKSLASLKEHKGLLSAVNASVIKRLDGIESRSSSRIVKTPAVASASGNAEVKIDMDYIKRLTQ